MWILQKGRNAPLLVFVVVLSQPFKDRFYICTMVIIKALVSSAEEGYIYFAYFFLQHEETNYVSEKLS